MSLLENPPVFGRSGGVSSSALAEIIRLTGKASLEASLDDKAPVATSDEVATSDVEEPPEEEARGIEAEEPPGIEDQEAFPAIRIRPEDFLVEAEIGVGAFGRVAKVVHGPSKRQYAMKTIAKKILRRKKISQREWRLERDVLVKIEPHPYVVELACAFQTTSCFYLVMTYLAGGELFEFLRARGTFAEDVAAFYAAEVTLALEHLHSCGVIHRDLKPENLLLDDDGHVVVTDFGLAKLFESHEEVHRTLCGTDEYMAPEMVARRSYGKAVDLWSLGILIFEMVAGKTPFSGKDTKELHRKILTEKLKFPSILNAKTVSVLRGLLERQVPKRLGAAKATMFDIGGFDALKNHLFFKSIEWQPLARRESPAPFVALPQMNHMSPGNNKMALPTCFKVVNRPLSESSHYGGASDKASTVRDFEYLRDGSFEPLSPTSTQHSLSSLAIKKQKGPRPPRKRKKKGLVGETAPDPPGGGGPSLKAPPPIDLQELSRRSGGSQSLLDTIPDSTHLLKKAVVPIPPPLALDNNNNRRALDAL